jgi:hypothetical protein
MPDRVPALAQKLLRIGSAQPRFQRGGARFLVEREQAVEPLGVQRDHAREALMPRLQPADDRRAAAERNDRDRALRARRQDLADLLVRLGQHDRVGRVGAVPAAQPQEVGRRLPPGVANPRLCIGADVRVADDRRERGAGVVAEHRLWELHLVDGGNRGSRSADPEPLPEQIVDRGRQLHRLGRITPA